MRKRSRFSWEEFSRRNGIATGDSKGKDKGHGHESHEKEASDILDSLEHSDGDDSRGDQERSEAAVQGKCKDIIGISRRLNTSS